MILDSEQATSELGHAIAACARAGDSICLSGPLGVGKTALARAIIGGLGHRGEVPSPTFAIVQPYEALDPPIWHVDLYRIENPREIDELGLDEADRGLLLVEWPERAGEGAFPGALRLVLDFAGGDARSLTAEVPPSWTARWPL